MRSNSFVIVLFVLALITGCGGGGGGGGGGSATPVKTLVSITVTPANSSIAMGTMQRFSATGTFSDNTSQDLSTAVTWTSSNTGVATIDATGSATAVAAGTTTITATSSEGISGSTTLTCTSATLVSVVVTPANPSIALGTVQQFSAMGTFSDNTIQNLTSTASWSSSLTSVATISNIAGSNGKATPIAVGTTTITASIPVSNPIAGSISNSTSLTVTAGAGGSGTDNVLPITVNGSLCSNATSSGYFNKPCVSLTVCTPGSSTCQVISDILLDTGSTGLRIFKQALGNVALTQVTTASGALAECIQFGGGSEDWGPVQLAKVVLGNEPAVEVPIQVIDSTFGTRPRGCQNADISAASAGLTGILGVGLFAQDCGSLCASSANNRNYYACNGSVCSETTAPLGSQVQNPVALLPQDNNGVLVQLPSIPLSGEPSVNGSLILGIGTRANNAPAGAVAYPANSLAEFTTVFNGVSLPDSFIDSGSNSFFFLAPANIPDCGGQNTGFYCPASTASLSAVNTGAFGSPSGTVPFQIGNFDTLTGGANNVFNDVGASQTGGFDWGLPFFFGRNVFVGFDGTGSSLGSGPYWAY